MVNELVYVPGGDDSFVELSGTQRGRRFRKHILSVGPLYYGSKQINIDEAFLSNVQRNFQDHVVSHVQAPVVNEQNAHSEDPFRNIGEVVDLEIRNGKLYSIIEVRDDEAAPKMGKTLLGASAKLSLNWKNNKTNEYVGPTLIHTAITNNAHLNDLEDFEEVLAMSNDSSNTAVLLSAAPETKESIMDLDEFITKGREEFDIDIPALQRAAAESDQFASLSASLQGKLEENGLIELSADSESHTEDIVAAVTSIIETNVELSARVESLEETSVKDKAEARIEDLVKTGFITPAKKAENLELLLSNAELFERLLPESPIVELSAEEGEEVKDETHDVTVADEVSRLSSFGEAQGLTVKA